MACVRYNQRDSFVNYMKNAYNLFFDNEYESIDTQDAIDKFCEEKDIDSNHVKSMMHYIDSDHSNTISALEFFESLLTALKQDLDP